LKNKLSTTVHKFNSF